MKSFIYSKKVYFIIVIIISIFWIINSFIPATFCRQTYYSIFHWNVCSEMSLLLNSFFIIFQIITVLGTAYLIVLALLFLQQNPK